MIVAAFVLGLLVVVAAGVYAWSLSKYHVRPRLALAQVAVIGKTEDSETVQISTTLFTDEDHETCQKKLDAIYKIREDRLQYQNIRMTELQEQIKRDAEEARKELEEAGATVTTLSPKKA